jgi:hypothetical protein
MLKVLIVASASSLTQLVSCVPAPGGEHDSGPPPTCPTSALDAGSTNTVELTHDGRTRSFRVHVPEGYT